LLEQLGCEIDRVEVPEEDPAEYPEIAAGVALRVACGRADRGILIGGTGMGMCIAANKVPGVRAAVCDDELMAEMSRRYLDANVICLSAHLVSEAMIARMIAIWIKTPFEGGRHARRLDKLSLLEQEPQPHACGT
jgi:ribose 5-phosphate isomerase B